MSGHSLGRRSSMNPVRISMFDKEDKNLMRTEPRRTQTSKPKISLSAAESSHIPRPRLRASSCDRASIKGLKATSKTPLCHGPTTPRTPVAYTNKSSLLAVPGSSKKIHAGLPTGRRSLSADRASSISAKGPKKDTRPLTDKAYQAEMLNKIDNYFFANHCSSMLNSNGSLKPVTLKMFVEVSAYLLKTLDIKQPLSINNYVEELPKIAKKLRYPGIINKSWLKTANAMHSWANVLGWICWLVEICEVRSIAFEKYNLENLPFLADHRDANTNRNDLFSMLNFYNAWNDEKLDEEASMVEKYLEEMEEQLGVKKEDLDIAQSELEEQMAKLHAAEEKTNKIDEEVKQLQQELSSLQEREAKQLADISAKEEYLKTINFEIVQTNDDCKALCEQIRSQGKQHDELLSIIKQQSMSKVDRDKILEKCREKENYIRQLDECLQEMQKELYTMDIKLASTNNNLTKAVLTYNQEIFMHLSDNADVDLNELKMPETGILHPEIMEILNAKASLMNNFKELIKTQSDKKKRSLELNSKELEKLQERMKLLEDEHGNVASKIQEKKSLMVKIKTDAKNEEAKLREQIKTLQNDIKEIQDSMPNLEQSSAELKEVLDKLDAVRRRKTYIEESARQFFGKFYEILGEHRSELYSILKKFNLN